MQSLLDALAQKMLVIPGDSYAPIMMVTSLYNRFRPEKVVKLNLLAKNFGFHHSRSSLAKFVFGHVHDVCSKYQSAVWECFQDYDWEKKDHLACDALLLKRVLTKLSISPSDFRLSKYRIGHLVKFTPSPSFTTFCCCCC